MSGFGVKSEKFGPIPASITATTGADGPILSGFLRNRTRQRVRTKTTTPERRGKKSLKNVRGCPGEVRARDASVVGSKLGTLKADNSQTHQVSCLCFSLRSQSRYGDARRPVDLSTCESRAAALRPRGRGGGSATGGSAWVWRAGIWEDRRPEAPADGRERGAVRRWSR